MDKEMLDQLRSVFFEEAEEGLAVMESGLLRLDEGSRDPELINSIFRAAHSIKGGSGTFGFDALIGFTHEVETLLDRMRSGSHPIESNGISVLLRAVDHLRALLVAAMNDEPAAAEPAAQVREELQEMLSGPAVAEPPAEPVLGQVALPKRYLIEFRPDPGVMRSGNDPVLMLRELGALGPCRIQVDATRLPPLQELDAVSFYLGFFIELETTEPVAAINEVFAWVADEAKVQITEALPHIAPESKLVPFSTDAAAADAAPASPSTQEAGRPAAEGRSGPLTSADSGSVRVGIEKIDALINLVGELVITQSMLGQIEKTFDMTKLERLRDGLSELERNTRELQESVMRIRMLPIRFVFCRFPRMVHDLSRQLDKQVQLTLSGEGTELDKTVMEKIGDPLVHLVRNALDHGIEPADARRAHGKDPVGQISLTASHQGGSIVIEVADDGRGLDEEKILRRAIERGLVEPSERPSTERIFDLLFHPGFSTAEQVSDVSGRGVGLDVVRRNIRELGGHIIVRSTLGHGSTFTIRLPLTLAILDGQLVQIGRQLFVVPLVAVVETVEIDAQFVHGVAGRHELYRLHDEYIPIVRLYDLFGIANARATLHGSLLMVIEGAGQRAGFLVDDLLTQQQVVIKSLESNFRRVDGISGATILGDGTVALIIDTGGLINFATRRASMSKTSREAGQDAFVRL